MPSFFDNMSGDAKAWVLVFSAIAFACCFAVFIWGLTSVLSSHCFV